jgi:hypothetical protein
VLIRLDQHVGVAKRIARGSALMRYLYLNLGVAAAPQRIWQRLQARRDEEAWVGNVQSDADPERLRTSKRAVDEFLTAIPSDSGLERDEILFLVDGLRPQLYDPEHRALASESFAAQLTAYFIEKARAEGFEAADLEARFIDHYASRGERFEFEDDAHWNPLGHEQAAAAILESDAFRSLLEERDIELAHVPAH